MLIHNATTRNRNCVLIPASATETATIVISQNKRLIRYWRVSIDASTSRRTTEITRLRPVISPFENARSATRVHFFGYARHGRDGCGVRVPCTSLGTFQRSVYQVSALRREVRDEGNCARVTERGKEACDRVRKRRVCYSPPGRDLVQAARLRTETWYKAGEVRRVSTTSRSRPQTTAQVNHELAQRNLTFLSGETCIGGIRAVVAPASRACPKAGNGAAQAAPGGAGVSRGRSTATRNPIEPGRTER
jgi:hypothetical protein